MATGEGKATITGAISEVLREHKQPMTTAEIHHAIETAKLYTFNAKNPSGVVATQLRRHTEGANPRIAAKSKLFVRTAEGKYTLATTAPQG
jgi:hypothetical protein